jgi:SAM-dependent methyltransferase
LGRNRPLRRPRLTAARGLASAFGAADLVATHRSFARGRPVLGFRHRRNARHGGEATRIMSSLYDDPLLYDLLFAAEPHATFYKALAREQRGNVLELACGTGQLLVPIAELGWRGVGLDVHPAMLAAAGARARNAEVEVTLLEGNMRDFALTEVFSLVFVARNSLLHLHTRDDFRRFFASVRDHLADGGLLAFDVFNPSVSLLAGRSEQRRLVERVAYPGRGTLTVEASTDYDEQSQVNRATWFVSSEAEKDLLVAPLHLRCLFPEELTLMLEHFGFSLEARYGDFSSGPFRSSSRQQICVCRAA